MSEHTPITIPMTVSADDTTFEMSVGETEVSRTVPVSSQVAYTGPQGPQGDPGPAGRDGIDGQDGAPGRDGIDGQDGAPGQDGADGYSPTVQIVEGEGRHVIAITDKNGTHTTTVLDGSDGAQGEEGPAGYTPVRGTDYWTAADQQTVIDAAVAAVLDAYPAAESEAF